MVIATAFVMLYNFLKSVRAVLLFPTLDKWKAITTFVSVYSNIQDNTAVIWFSYQFRQRVID